MRWRRTLLPADRGLGWRVAVLFMVGAMLFAVGSFPAYWALVDDRVVAGTFVVGAVFFTSAAYHQYLQVVNDPEDAGPDGFRWWAWRPRSLLWWATLVQLAGTLLFNVNTILALAENLTVRQTNRLVWAPDLFGSLAFLIASQLAWRAVCGRQWCVRREDPDWWSAALNYLGSVFFGFSALAAFTLPTTGEMVNITVVNVGTFLGAVCFLVGAYVLLPAAPDRRARVAS